MLDRTRVVTMVCSVALAASCKAEPKPEPAKPDVASSVTATSAARTTHDTTAKSSPPTASIIKPGAPPKPVASAAPALPALPALAKQEKHPTTAAPAKDGYECGAVWSGDAHYALSCLGPLEKDHAIEKTAVVLVPYDRLRTRAAPLPTVVDHRADGTEGVVRNQNPTGTCTAFGTAAAIDHSVARWTGKPAHVSVTQVWARYHDFSLGDALRGSAGKSLTSEENWPFKADEAWPWRSCADDAKKKRTGPCAQPVDAKRLAQADAKPVVVIEQVEWLLKDFELMRMKIAAGQDLVFAMRMPESGHFTPTGAAGAKYIPDFDKPGDGGHIMAIAGYAMMPPDKGGGGGGDNYYLLHNSWGTKWGDGGYAWMHEATLLKHMDARFGVIDAHPADDARSKHRTHASCTGKLVPDSIGGDCVEKCADGSPPHAGVCANASDCAAGYVNLTGACVLAAPTESSRDPATSIRWECGPGGCAYWLPKGAAGAEASVVSCPAPSFRVAKDHNGATCVE